jgi:hypothetical protein
MTVVAQPSTNGRTPSSWPKSQSRGSCSPGFWSGSRAGAPPAPQGEVVRSNNRVRMPSPGVRSVPGGRISGAARMSSVLCSGLRLR